eukprot:965102-Amphidinium_carterae.1
MPSSVPMPSECYYPQPRTPGGAMGLQKRFLKLKDMLGITSLAWTLASIRGGGCVHFALHSTDMDYWQWKGRWSTQKSMRHYLQMGLGVASFSRLEDAAKSRVMQLAGSGRTGATAASPTRRDDDK